MRQAAARPDPAWPQLFDGGRCICSGITRCLGVCVVFAVRDDDAGRHRSSGVAPEGAISGSAMALANQMLRSMLLGRLTAAVLAVLFLGTIVARAGLVAQAGDRQSGKPEIPQIAAKADEPDRAPHRGECSSSAACSTHMASRCPARRCWSMPGP